MAIDFTYNPLEVAEQLVGRIIDLRADNGPGLVEIVHTEAYVGGGE